MKYRLIFLVATMGISFSSMSSYAATGRTVGQFSVSATGSAQYNIPIFAPPGPHGMQPGISLFYDSRQGIGPLGLGWTIAGLGEITRCNKTVAQDGIPAPVALATSDGYCINGNRLRLTSATGTYGASGSTYQTEVADFSNITATGAAGNGPAYFTVQARNGLTYYYGYTDANGNGQHSQVLAYDSSTAITWLLSKVIDRAGNNYVINYTTLSGALVGTAVPSTIYWTPTTAGGSSYTYTMQFNYSANVPQSSINKYVAGTNVTNPQILNSIEVLYESTVVKDYFLGYSASTTTARKQLTSVQECPSTTQSSSACFAATTISYAQPTPGVSPTLTTVSSGTTYNVASARYDLNGDGIPDIIFSNGTYWMVSFGSVNGYQAPVSTTIPIDYTILPGNLNGGPEDGILAVTNTLGRYWAYYTYNGAAFESTPTTLSFDSTVLQYQLADINGDGYPDLIALRVSTGTATIDYYPNTFATSGSVEFGASTTGYTLTSSALVSANLVPPDSQYGKLRRYDFNGDGRDDLVLTVFTYSGGVDYFSTYEILTTQTGFSAYEIATVSGNTSSNVYFTEWNDDKCTDYVFNNTLYISGCNGSVPSSVALAATVVGVMDWDGDGRTDLIVDNGTYLGVYLSKGVTSPAPTLTSTTIPYSANCLYITMDAEGNGLDDLGCLNPIGPSFGYYPHNGPPDFMSSVADGYGNSASPTYVSIAKSNYTPYPSSTLAPTFPDIVYVGPLYVVSEVVFSDPSSNSASYNQTFHYYAAWTNLQGRGFEGFQTLYTADSRTSGLSRYQYFEQQFPWTWMKYTDLLTTPVFYPIETVGTPNTLAQATLSGTVNEERYFPYFTNVTSTQKELGGAENGDLITTTSTNYTYDGNGNATTVATTVTDNDPGSPNANPYVNDTWTSTTVNTISADTSTWCLTLPTLTTVTNSSTAPGGASITRTINYTPDYTNCRESQKVTAPGTAYQVTEAYGFDSFGNLNSDAVTGTGMSARTTSITWNTTGQFPSVITNPLSQSITLGFDPTTGKKISQTDPNYTSTNPLMTTWAYDGFGRKTRETRPDGTYTTWTYNDCATDGGCILGSHSLALSYSIYTTANALENDGTTYFDTVDRPLMANAMMLSGSFSRNEVRYDSLGRVAQQAMPCIYSAVTTPCTYWTTNTYDLLNRLTQSQRPISSTNSTLQTTTYGYAGRTTTVTDALNNTTTKLNLVTGAMARSKDPKGYYQNFTYDAFGSLLSVTDSASPANTLSTATYHYGLQAFKTASTDVDLGARSYTVDPLGEVTAYSDAKSQNFTQTYDALSRPLIRTEPDLTTTWTWGPSAASYNIGKLQSVTAASTVGTYSDTYTYDSQTRLSSRLISNPGDRTYNYVWTYSPTTGQLSTLQYPTDISFILTLQYAYSNGILQSISSNSYSPTEVFWTADATNPRGQVTQETLGNGVVINRGFDAVTGWLGSVQAGPGSGATLQNNSYAYDYDGNVTQRQDNNQGLTENFYYDTLNRLDHSTLNGSPNLQMAYDTVGMGNIASRSDVAAGAAWTYDPVHIHQVTQAGSASNAYVYDANGNVTSRNGYAITWSSYNYPTGVNSGGESVTFQYGPNRERWQEIYTGGPNGTEKTNRAGKLFEVAIYGGLSHYRHYIYAGKELVAVDDRTTEASPLYYIVGDHQGGIASIENSANPGTNFVSESFTAFGMRRSGETWSGPVSTADETSIDGVSRRGYTGQSVLGVNMYLNHMNGRIEDAVTGRFLSPDPNVPDPGNTQSYNRYSYVNNNPATMVDPSGFDDTPVIDGGPADTPGGLGIEVDSSRDQNPLSPFPAGLLASVGAAGSAALGNTPDKVSTQSNPTANPNNGQTAEEIVVTAAVPNALGFSSISVTQSPAQRNAGLCSNASINAISGAAGGALAGGAALSEFGPGGIAVGAFLGGLAGGITGYVSTSTLANQVAGGAANGVVAPSFNAAASGATGGAVGGAFTYGAQQAGFPDVVSVPAGGAAGGFFAGAAATGVANSALTAAEGGAAGGAIGLAAGATTVAVAAALHAACGN